MIEKRLYRIKYFLKALILWFLTASFLVFYPAEMNSAPKKKTSSAKMKSSSKKRKMKKVSRKKKSKKKKSKKKRKKRRGHRRRSYNPEKTIAMAKELIRSQSFEISSLAGLTPYSGDAPSRISRNDTLSCPTGNKDDFFMEFENYIDGEEEPADMNTFKTVWLKYAEDGLGGDMTEGGIYKQDIMNEIMEWLGTPYYFGGSSRTSIDCSAFTRAIFLNSASIRLPRVARDQIFVGRNIGRDELEFGDLIFFHTYSNKFASHVGIFLGDELFAHASSRYGVTVSSLSSAYYNSHYIGARRLTVQDVLRLTVEVNKEEVTEN